jgi:HAMP domain-containing protein
MARVARKNTARADLALLKVTYAEASKRETDAQIEARLADRFDILDVLTEGTIVGNSRALIVSGAPGVGKSFGVEKMLRQYDPSGETYTIVKGYTRPTGLVKLLYQYRHAGNIIVFDDADSVFQDDIGLNILKCVADTTDRRTVSWLSEGKLVDETTAEIIPRSFDFEGGIIFLSNLNFEYLIDKGSRIAPHLEAMMSRAFYLDLSMRSKRDSLIRIRQVIKAGMLADLPPASRDDVVGFIEANFERMRELSLRSAVKLAALRKTSARWEKIASITMLKNG